MVYDPVGGYDLYFGGGATWKFDRGNWTQLHPTVEPEARTSAALAFDAADGYAVLFGGSGRTGQWLNDTWRFSAGNWTNISGRISPSVRSGAMMVYDARTSEVVLFGGTGAGPYCSTACNDTWVFRAGTWRQLTSTHPPSTSSGAAMTYDAADGVVVLFTTNVSRNAPETWTFKAGNWTLLSPRTTPSVRTSPELAYDPGARYTVLFGGKYGTSHLNDTWKFYNGSWTRLNPSNPPPDWWSGIMVFDKGAGGLVLTGGQGEPCSQPLGCGLEWKYVPGAWIPIHLVPEMRSHASMAYDAAIGSVVLFGGNSGLGLLNDTWEFAAGTWSLLRTTVAPSPRYGAGFANDTNGSSLILFGGEGTAGPLGDSWQFSAGKWTRLSVTPAPSPRDLMGLVFDPLVGTFLLFGGEANRAIFNDTWTFDGTAWTNISGGAAPTARAALSLVFDASDRYVLLFGGANSSTLIAPKFSDAWAFNSTGWHRIPSPHKLPCGTVTPPIGYDSNLGKVILAGSEATCYWAFVAWTYHAGAWVSVSTSKLPTYPQECVLADDPADSEMVIFGFTGSATTWVTR